MANMQLYKPFEDLWDFSDFFLSNNASRSLQRWAPAVNVKEDAEGVYLQAEVPGMKKEDISIKIHDGVLTIQGEKKFRDEEKRENYHRIEQSFGSFSRSFTLPKAADTDKIQASLKDGVLELSIPKLPEAKPREVEVKVH